MRLLSLLLLVITGLLAQRLPAQVAIPLPARELRGAWIATVHNINWPSEPGLPATRQKEQLLRLIQSAHDVGINCLIFQVRPAGDAFYESTLEPWSPYLSGLMSLPPSPRWDPLAFAIEEAHKRGMELHAWFNPFRALAGDKHKPSNDHIRRLNPEWTVAYNKDVWMNPGIPEVRQRAIDVMLDVTRRYDVDGIHMDDYFYPYPVNGADGKPLPFNDAEAYAKYNSLGGLTLSLSDWRRQNVNEVVQKTYAGIKGIKRTVKFGISPFGLWRPNYPEGTGGGLDPYEHLAADSRKWLQQGWVDYLTPQLYWTIDRPKLGFATFYDWWLGENTAGRHIWPGMNTSKVGDDRNAGEIMKQISILRERGLKMTPGHFHWNFGALDKNLGKVGTMTKERAYNVVALPPASPWLSNVALPAPKLEKSADGQRLSWSFHDPRWEGYSRWWVVQAMVDGKWQTQKIFFKNQRELAWPAKATAVAVRAAGPAWEISPAGLVSR